MKNLPKNPAVNGTPASDAMARSMAKGEKGRAFGQAVEVLDVFPGLPGHDDQDGKTQQRHEQVGDEIKRNGLSRERDDADEQIAGVGNARISEETFQVILGKGRQVSVNQGEQGDRNQQPLRFAGSMKNGSSTRRRTTNPAAFEPTDRNAVTGVGAP